MYTATLGLGGVGRGLRFGIIAAFLALSGVSAQAALLIEQPAGDIHRYTAPYADSSRVSFDFSEGMRVEGVRFWMYGTGEATVTIYGPDWWDPTVEKVYFQGTFTVESPQVKPMEELVDAAMWQGLGGIHWDLGLAGTYQVEVKGGLMPYALPIPFPATIQRPYDFERKYDGIWYDDSLPFGLQIYGTPLSAVPEPGTYGLAGGLMLLAVGAFRRRRIKKAI